MPKFFIWLNQTIYQVLSSQHGQKNVTMKGYLSSMMTSQIFSTLWSILTKMTKRTHWPFPNKTPKHQWGFREKQSAEDLLLHLTASKRILSKPKVKKLPLMPFHLIQIGFWSARNAWWKKEKNRNQNFEKMKHPVRI